MGKKRTPATTSRAEKAIFWVGSLCGIVVSVITIHEKILAPSPARLAVAFFESATQTLSLVPPIDTASELTEEIPLQLKVQNLGGRASGNTKLYLAYNHSLEVTAEYQKEQRPTWNAPNEPLRQLSLAIENINPGESYLIPVKIRFRVPKDIQRAMRQPRGEIVDQKQLLPRGFQIFSDLSSDTVPNVRTVLEILLGRCDVLQERSADVFWVGHGTEGVSVLKVKEDYPCR